MIKTLGILWRNREILTRIATVVESAIRTGADASEVRRRLADGVQREDVVSSDALERVIAVNRRMR